ncbi:DMT family transporter [Prochlorococcus sp. MIT 1223]|uniref:DMT family transporter n=1 Tax=Prochlorococcus sp. MIT 1223 TaxID=3096217 RepID=UPI002A75DB17|nr:DMT family transporter [Prochlorococcus sp. MIT 1223]
MFVIWRWFLMVLPFALWGTSMAAMAPLVNSGGPEIVAFLRLLPAGLLVIFAAVILKRKIIISKGDLFWFLVFTLVDASLFQIFLAKGLSQTGAGLGSVLIDSQPLMVALLARAIFGDLINPIGWIGLILGLAGIICLGVPANFLNHWLLLGNAVSDGILLSHGELWMLAAALAMALGTVLIRFACKESDPVAVTGWHMALGSLPIIAWHSFNTVGSIWPDWTSFDWLLMLYASLFGSALAYGLFFWFANQLELTSFSTLAFLTPVFALFTGGIWLGERLELLQWVGVVMIFISVLLVSQRNRFWGKQASLDKSLEEGIT